MKEWEDEFVHMPDPEDKAEWSEELEARLQAMKEGDLGHMSAAATFIMKRASARRICFLDEQAKLLNDSDLVQFALSIYSSLSLDGMTKFEEERLSIEAGREFKPSYTTYDPSEAESFYSITPPPPSTPTPTLSTPSTPSLQSLLNSDAVSETD